jgi:hypothetical protein
VLVQDQAVVATLGRLHLDARDVVPLASPELLPLRDRLELAVPWNPQSDGDRLLSERAAKIQEPPVVASSSLGVEPALVAMGIVALPCFARRLLLLLFSKPDLDVTVIE